MGDYSPFIDSSEILEDGEALRERAGREGYLYVRGLLPREAVAKAREAVLQACADAGWVSREKDLSMGVAAADLRIVEGQPEFLDVYDRIQSLEEFHRLALHPRIVGLFRTLFGEEVLVHPRNICRVFFPNTGDYTTPAHQDYAQIGGTSETWTAWIPLGDCPVTLGGLAILAGSNREELLPHHASIGVGGKAVETGQLAYNWVSGDMATGDFLAFHSHTVHRALPNTTPDRLRLSVDYRYQPVSHPVREDSLFPHYGRLTWEQVYAGWRSKEGQYFWKGQDLTIAQA